MPSSPSQHLNLQNSQFHFIGIGGIGMCGLAELLHNMGARVTGSDLSENTNTLHLQNVGIQVYKGHQADQVGAADVVVFSSAVNAKNPEIVAAKERKIPLIPRAEALAEIMRLKRGVAVAGTHGKTTTTSMIAAIFLHADLQPTIVVGGRLDLIQSTALLGTGDWLVAEADESDGSFQRLAPEIAVITNIDSDHLDYFKTFSNVQKAFIEFAGKIPFYGAVFICGDDPKAKKLFAGFNKNIFFYGFGTDNDYRLQGSQGVYEIFHHDKQLGVFQLNVPGLHNALNATAAILTGLRAGLSFANCAAGLLSFQGVDRRFHYKGNKGDILVYDDYGHHPTEVRATLQSFREKFPHSRLLVLFQPHRYSRTKNCWEDFITCFDLGDQILLTDIYAAGEKPLPHISSENLAEQVVHPSCRYVTRDQILTTLQQSLQSGDILLTLGAGDVWKVGMEFLNAN